jgi:hypothetical protein
MAQKRKLTRSLSTAETQAVTQAVFPRFQFFVQLQVHLKRPTSPQPAAADWYHGKLRQALRERAADTCVCVGRVAAILLTPKMFRSGPIRVTDRSGRRAACDPSAATVRLATPAHCAMRGP